MVHVINCGLIHMSAPWPRGRWLSSPGMGSRILSVRHSSSTVWSLSSGSVLIHTDVINVHLKWRPILVFIARSWTAIVRWDVTQLPPYRPILFVLAGYILSKYRGLRACRDGP